MIDQLTKLRARKAASDYQAGKRLKQEASELSTAKLAGKFEVSEHTILRAIDNMPCVRLSDDEAALVRACYTEHKTLTAKAARLTMNALAHHYQVAVSDIQVELDLAGYVSPQRKTRQEAMA